MLSVQRFVGRATRIKQLTADYNHNDDNFGHFDVSRNMKLFKSLSCAGSKF